MAEWIKSKFKGLRYREHPTETRGTGRSKRAIRYIQMVYKWEGKTICESLGWEKDDWEGGIELDEDSAYSIFLELKRNRKTRQPPYTFKERNRLREKDLEEKRALEEAEKARLEAMAVPFHSAWQEYIADRRSHWGELHYQDHIRLAQFGGDNARRGTRTKKPGPLAPLMKIAMVDLTAERIEKWLKKEVKDRPTQAKLAFRLLRAFLGWCGDEHRYKAIINTSLLTKRTTEAMPKSKAKDDSLQKEQLSVWFTAVRQLGNPVMSAYLQGLLLTGARRRELSRLKWEDIDFRWKSLTIRDKVDGERTIPLTPFVENILRFLPKKNEFVFSSSSSKSGQIMEPTRAHQRALRAAGLEGISLHGLRRSFGSLAEWLEIPAGIVAQIQGHKPSALAEKHYRVRPLDLLRLWHTKLEAWIIEQAGIELPEAIETDIPTKIRLVSNQ